jgi:hypothetical protein
MDTNIEPNDDLLDLVAAVQDFKSITITSRNKLGELVRRVLAQQAAEAKRHEEAEREYREQVIAKVQRVADAIDATNVKPKIDPWKFVRNTCNYIVGEIDKRIK